MKSLFLVLLSFVIFSTAFPAQQVPAPPVSQPASPYCGCLLFVDDIRKPDEIIQVERFPTTLLLRSWYRWGEPSEGKEYARRADLIRQLKASGVRVGGGTSLSVVNARDLARKDFDASWLSVNLRGTIVEESGRQYATLSAPGFRSYLIARLIEQAKLGVIELHLGEPNGAIYFDDWTLGLKGGGGFIQWIRNKYKEQPLRWWKSYLGPLGEAIFNKAVRRKHFLDLPETYSANFMSEWGKPGSWEGRNTKGGPAFLSFLYRKNLESFLSELHTALKANKLAGVTVDVPGFADWMRDLSFKPDAFIGSPPDEQWGLNWSTNPAFSFRKYRTRLRNIMSEQIRSVAPTPVIYIIDHPKPFRDFIKLPDDQQAALIKFFSELTRELGANFAFFIYSEDEKAFGSKATEAMRAECQKRVGFCPPAN